MSSSDSDSDTPSDVHDLLGLPSLSTQKRVQNGVTSQREEHKDEWEWADGRVAEAKPNKKAFNKFRNNAKDLLAKTEPKNKMMILSSNKIAKLCDELSLSEPKLIKPVNLDVNDPRFNYEVILSKGYKLLRKMGNGAYASVFLWEKVSNPEQKWVLKISIGEERIPDTKNEYEILKNLDYYSIPKAEDWIIDYNFLYSIIWMEYSDIDLNVLQYVQEHGCLDEKEVKLAMKELLKAIKYIHSIDYAHRDVKPDNVLIKVTPAEEGKEKEVKIILVDYNIAKKAKSFRSKEAEEAKEPSETIRFRCNYLTHIASQNSQAPELFKSGYYSESVDIWGAGLVFYTLITGEKIKRGDEEIIKEQVIDITNLSQSGKDLLLQMFLFEGESRPTANEALTNPWFAD